MRVNMLTLATASAAALTFGLASPALAAPALGDHQWLQTQGAQSRLLPAEAQYQTLLQRGGGDDDCGDDGGCGISISRHRSCGSFASCRGLFRHRGLFSGGFGGWGGGGWGGGDWGGGGGGDGVDYSDVGKFAAPPPRARVMRARPRARRAVARPGRMMVHRRQVVRVPRRAVPTGFGGGQGVSLPLGIAGLSLILGGVGLLPLARRRIRTSERA